MGPGDQGHGLPEPRSKDESRGRVFRVWRDGAWEWHCGRRREASDATLRQGLAGARITMKTKRPIPQWLKDWKANRPQYHNYSGTEGDGCFGPAEDDVSNT